MIKTLTSYLDYGSFAEIALAIFATVFVVVVIRTLATRREQTGRYANIVLNEDSEVEHDIAS
jgi:hypothetical protein